MKTYDGTSISEARAIQQELIGRLSIRHFDGPLKVLAGADVSLNLYSTTVYAGIVLLHYPQLVPFACALVKAEVKFPYVPGFLAFREVPPLMKAWEMLPQKPDVMMVDGHGIAHPRKMGIASHFGALSGQRTMGCAKKILFGKYEEPGLEAGNFSPLTNGTELLGYAMRTKKNVKPVFVSPGHLMDAEDCRQLIMKCVIKHRLPEPTRMAHHFVNTFRTGKMAEGFHYLQQNSLF